MKGLIHIEGFDPFTDDLLNIICGLFLLAAVGLVGMVFYHAVVPKIPPNFFV